MTFKLSTALLFKDYWFSKNDTSLVYKRNDSQITFLVIYVDDILVIKDDTSEISAIKNFMDTTFKIKGLGRLHYFLDIEFNYMSTGVILSWKKFILDMLAEFDCSYLSSVVSPLDSSIKLLPGEGISITDLSLYRKLLGKLKILTNTRPD